MGQLRLCKSNQKFFFQVYALFRWSSLPKSIYLQVQDNRNNYVIDFEKRLLWQSFAGTFCKKKCSRDLSQQLGNLLRIDASAINRLWHDLQEHVQFVVTNKSSFVKFASSAEGSESKSHSRRFCRPLARISLERVICGPRIEHGQCKLDWGSVTTFSQCLAGHLG